MTLYLMQDELVKIYFKKTFFKRDPEAKLIAYNKIINHEAVVGRSIDWIYFGVLIAGWIHVGCIDYDAK